MQFYRMQRQTYNFTLLYNTLHCKSYNLL